jgi:hypothetical protein
MASFVGGRNSMVWDDFRWFNAVADLRPRNAA